MQAQTKKRHSIEPHIYENSIKTDCADTEDSFRYTSLAFDIHRFSGLREDDDDDDELHYIFTRVKQRADRFT
jgi:hypothetical protein